MTKNYTPGNRQRKRMLKHGKGGTLRPAQTPSAVQPRPPRRTIKQWFTDLWNEIR